MAMSSAAAEPAPFEALRRQRAELRESMSALELALSGPAARGEARWMERVNVALVELSADFRAHVEFTEGHEGLYADILVTAPRLCGAVDRLTHEHTEITGLLENLIAVTSPPEGNDVDQVRNLGNAILGVLVGHRQRGSDLVYQAYEFDIGGET
jgi:hypothetical protein